MCDWYALCSGKTTTKQKSIEFVFVRKVIKVAQHWSHCAKEVWSVGCVFGTPEYVMGSIFKLVSTRTRWAGCKLELKEMELPRFRLTAARRLFPYRAAAAWNGLPRHVTDAASKRQLLRRFERWWPAFTCFYMTLYSYLLGIFVYVFLSSEELYLTVCIAVLACAGFCNDWVLIPTCG